MSDEQKATELLDAMLEDDRLHRVAIKERREAELVREREKTRSLRAIVDKLFVEHQAALKSMEP